MMSTSLLSKAKASAVSRLFRVFHMPIFSRSRRLGWAMQLRTAGVTGRSAIGNTLSSLPSPAGIANVLRTELLSQDMPYEFRHPRDYCAAERDSSSAVCSISPCRVSSRLRTH